MFVHEIVEFPMPTWCPFFLTILLFLGRTTNTVLRALLGLRFPSLFVFDIIVRNSIDQSESSYVENISFNQKSFHKVWDIPYEFFLLKLWNVSNFGYYIKVIFHVIIKVWVNKNLSRQILQLESPLVVKHFLKNYWMVDTPWKTLFSDATYSSRAIAKDNLSINDAVESNWYY